MTTVGLLHPGAMGASVGAQLVGAGHEVLWAGVGRSQDTVARAREAGLIDVRDIAEVASRSEVVLSICPPHAALDVAHAVVGFDGLYIDANAIAPQTAAQVAALVGPRLVDGGIVGPPPRRQGTTRLYVSGAHAPDVGRLFAGTALDVRVLVDGGPFAASALKMAYAAWTKGSAALFLAVGQAAQRLGINDALHEEWALSQPTLMQSLSWAQASATEKGWRWTGEMEEIASTFEAVDTPGGFHRAAAVVYRERGGQNP